MAVLLVYCMWFHFRFAQRSVGEPLWPRLHRQPVFHDWCRHVCLLRRLSSGRNHQQVRPGKVVQITHTHPVLAEVVSQRTDTTKTTNAWL